MFGACPTQVAYITNRMPTLKLVSLFVAFKYKYPIGLHSIFTLIDLGLYHSMVHIWIESQKEGTYMYFRRDAKLTRPNVIKKDIFLGKFKIALNLFYMTPNMSRLFVVKGNGVSSTSAH